MLNPKTNLSFIEQNELLKKSSKSVSLLGNYYNQLRMNQAVSGFSKLSKEEKIAWIAQTYFSTPKDAIQLLKNYWNSDEKIQKLHDEFIENTISNF